MQFGALEGSRLNGMFGHAHARRGLICSSRTSARLELFKRLLRRPKERTSGGSLELRGLPGCARITRVDTGKRIGNRVLWLRGSRTRRDQGKRRVLVPRLTVCGSRLKFEGVQAGEVVRVGSRIPPPTIYGIDRFYDDHRRAA